MTKKIKIGIRQINKEALWWDVVLMDGEGKEQPLVKLDFTTFWPHKPFPKEKLESLVERFCLDYVNLLNEMELFDFK